MKKIMSRETFLYLAFGGVTTVINYGLFYLCYQVMELPSTLANIVAFIAAVTFSFIANKQYVFESKSWRLPVIGPEILQYLGSRILTFFMEEFGLLVCDEWLKLGRFTILSLYGIVVDGVLLSKLILAIIAVIINYIFCKVLIFRKKQS